MDTPEVMNVMKTMASSTAAAVTRRPVLVEARRDGVGVVTGEVVVLLDAAEEEHLVVHRQAEGDAEHEDGREDVDRHRWR